ncbi:uncharacterized protein A4U43_C06F5470 [Asparagus officinalis]|uniref:Uncharacterized protein n=1 Tax=Asparagus officinalis TaxID=4686 RepID=A0A5P1EQB2_ASPOF|nr:uncharacterized protein A4U43_C06F5470 [Asparagus officinalis]
MNLNEPEHARNLNLFHTFSVFDFEIKYISDGVSSLKILTKEVKCAIGPAELNELKQEMRSKMDDIEHSSRIIISWSQFNDEGDNVDVKVKIVKVMGLLERLRKHIWTVKFEILKERELGLNVKAKKEVVSEVHRRLVIVQELFVEFMEIAGNY